MRVARRVWDYLLRHGGLSFGALASELADDASEPGNDDTTLAEGPVEWYKPEIVSVDVSVFWMVDGVPTMELQCLPGNDHTLVQEFNQTPT